jgi:hypothetical protein
MRLGRRRAFSPVPIGWNWVEVGCRDSGGIFYLNYGKLGTLQAVTNLDILTFTSQQCGTSANNNFILSLLRTVAPHKFATTLCLHNVLPDLNNSKFLTLLLIWGKTNADL